MSETLPLFPLGTVLYPGLLLPLHIFEERYRQLMGDLLDGSRPQRFGVIAIREGRETGVGGVAALYEIGCIAALRRVNKLDDGRFDVVTAGTQRFRLLKLDESRLYLQGEVDLLAEQDALHRLTAERALLSRETTMLRTLTSAPAPDLRYSPYSSN